MLSVISAVGLQVSEHANMAVISVPLQDNGSKRSTDLTGTAWWTVVETHHEIEAGMISGAAPTLAIPLPEHTTFRLYTLICGSETGQWRLI